MDNKQIDDILREQTPRLRSFVRRRVSNRDDADDIVQDTLYQFLQALRVLDNPIAHVASWLYTVAHNLIVNHGKRHRETLFSEYASPDDVTIMTDLSEILIADDGDRPDIQMLRRLVWDELDAALASLPSEQREAIVLTEIHGMSVREAAEATGVPLGTFLSRKHYAVTSIRKRLQTLYCEVTTQ